MPIRRLTASEVPQRRYSSFLTTTAEWHSAIEALHKGLKPFEALEIKLPPEVQRRSKWVYRSLAENFRRHLRDNHISVEVRFFNGKEMKDQAVYLIAPASEGTNHATPVPARRGPGRPPRAAAA